LGLIGLALLFKSGYRRIIVVAGFPSLRLWVLTKRVLLLLVDRPVSFRFNLVLFSSSSQSGMVKCPVMIESIDARDEA
jgi:hypothetical protein